jgi:hypothetical protein
MPPAKGKANYKADAQAWIEVAALYQHHSEELILWDLGISYLGSSLNDNNNNA